MKIKFLLYCFIILFFNSCASINFTTVKNDNKYISDAKGFLVFCNIEDMKLRKNFEKSIVDQLKESGRNAKESILLFPPVREYSALELKEKCVNEGLDVKLEIKQINSTTQTGYVYMYGMLLPVSSTDYTFDLVIQDFNDGEIILRSTINTDGDSLKSMISDIARRIVVEIKNESQKEKINFLQRVN